MGRHRCPRICQRGEESLGLVDELLDSRVCIDTAPIIYFIEKNPRYLNVVRPVFAEIDAGRIEAITSTITLLEVLVQPFRKSNKKLAEKYRAAIDSFWPINLLVLQLLWLNRG